MCKYLFKERSSVQFSSLILGAILDLYINENLIYTIHKPNFMVIYGYRNIEYTSISRDGLERHLE